MSKSKSKSGNRTQPGSPPVPRERGSNRPPRLTRTLAFGTREEAAGARPPPKPAPPPADSWRARASDLARALEQSLASPREDAATIAAIERAVAAFGLGGGDLDTVQRVAHLVGRAFEALHEPPVEPSPGALRGCAHVLYNGLPRRVREKTTFVRIEEVVLGLAGETESFPATVRATAELLGWSADAMNHWGHAIRIALAMRPEPIV
jgi:hypothetical protein